MLEGGGSSPALMPYSWLTDACLPHQDYLYCASQARYRTHCPSPMTSGPAILPATAVARWGEAWEAIWHPFHFVTEDEGQEQLSHAHTIRQAYLCPCLQCQLYCSAQGPSPKYSGATFLTSSFVFLLSIFFKKIWNRSDFLPPNEISLRHTVDTHIEDRSVRVFIVLRSDLGFLRSSL